MHFNDIQLSLGLIFAFLLTYVYSAKIPNDGDDLTSDYAQYLSSRTSPSIDDLVERVGKQVNVLGNTVKTELVLHDPACIG